MSRLSSASRIRAFVDLILCGCVADVSEEDPSGLDQGWLTSPGTPCSSGSQESTSSTYGSTPNAVDVNLRVASIRSAGRCDVPVGMVTVKVVPKFSTLLTLIVPPCRWT